MHQGILNRYLILPLLSSFMHENGFPLNRQLINVQYKINCRVSQKCRQLRDHNSRDGGIGPIDQQVPMFVGITCYSKIS